MTAFAQTSGAADVQRAVLIQLYSSLNSVASEINRAYARDDQALATLLRRTYTEIRLETIDSGNFYEGYRPSLINAPVDKYPNCSAWCTGVSPVSDSSIADQVSVFSNQLFVEIMVKSSTDSDVNIKCQRMAEAANICIMRDVTLGGRVSGLISEPIISFSEVFERREKTSHGDIFYWQAARLQYEFRKDSTLIGRTGPVFVDGLPYEIDQY